jgi:organic radical activating enzyme
MTSIIDSIKHLFTPHTPIPAGIYHYQAPPDAPTPYRLHLRLESDGTGLLMVNASTILHLNQTAAEYAYHLVKLTPEDQVADQVARRYRVKRDQALQDYRSLNERLLALIKTPDLDPVMFLDFERSTPHTQKISAPYRLDCALTYRLPENTGSTLVAPAKQIHAELTTQEWCSIFDKAWGLGIPHIILTGGEPTLRDDLPDLIAHTEANGQVVGLISDGMKLADNEYLQKLLQTGLDHLMLCINPQDDHSWQALNNVLSADLYVVVHLTLTEHNLSSIQQTLERLAQAGVKAISLSSINTYLRSPMEDLRNKVASLGLSLVWDLPVPYSSFNPIALGEQDEHTPPGAGHSWLYIEPDGDVLPAQGSDQVLGNILRDSWVTLWQ